MVSAVLHDAEVGYYIGAVLQIEAAQLYIVNYAIISGPFNYHFIGIIFSSKTLGIK